MNATFKRGDPVLGIDVAAWLDEHCAADADSGESRPSQRLMRLCREAPRPLDAPGAALAQAERVPLPACSPAGPAFSLSSRSPEKA